MKQQQNLTGKVKPFEKLSPHVKEELLAAYGNHMDALNAFDEAQNSLETFQFEKKAALKKAFEYVTNDLLELVDLPYDVAYIVSALDSKSKFITVKDMELVQIVISKSTFRGREQGIKLYAALKEFATPMQAITELRMMQSSLAKDHIKIENEFIARTNQLKVSQQEIAEIWAAANPEHPAVVRFNEQQSKALGMINE